MFAKKEHEKIIVAIRNILCKPRSILLQVAPSMIVDLIAGWAARDGYRHSIHPAAIHSHIITQREKAKQNGFSLLLLVNI
jgi:hypothetical protein